MKYDYQATISQDLRDVDEATIDERFEALEHRGRTQLEDDGIPPEDSAFHGSVDCLYEGQGYELNVEFDGTDGDWRDRIRDRFEEKHLAEYGHHFENDPVELLNVRVTAVGDTSNYTATDIGIDGTAEDALTDESEVVFGTSEQPETLNVPRYRRDALSAGNNIEGPAIVNQLDSTVVINPTWTATVLDNGALSLRRK